MAPKARRSRLPAYKFCLRPALVSLNPLTAIKKVKVIPLTPGALALRRLRHKGRDFEVLSRGSLLLTLRGYSSVISTTPGNLTR